MWTRLLPILLLLCCVPALAQNDIVSVKYDDTRLQRITIDEDDLSTYRSDEKFDYTLEKTENTWLSGIKNWLYNRISFRSHFLSFMINSISSLGLGVQGKASIAGGISALTSHATP